jgi:hypothetical protein
MGVAPSVPISHHAMANYARVMSGLGGGGDAVRRSSSFLRVEQAQQLTQLGRSQLYEQTRLWRETGGREGIPVVRFGRCLRIPTAALLRMALIERDPTGGADVA